MTCSVEFMTRCASIKLWILNLNSSNLHLWVFWRQDFCNFRPLHLYRFFCNCQFRNHLCNLINILFNCFVFVLLYIGKFWVIQKRLRFKKFWPQIAIKDSSTLVQSRKCDWRFECAIDNSTLRVVPDSIDRVLWFRLLPYTKKVSMSFSSDFRMVRLLENDGWYSVDICWMSLSECLNLSVCSLFLFECRMNSLWLSLTVKVR